MYRHPRVIDVMTPAEGVVQDLFGRFLEHPEDMPGEWAQGLGDADTFARARRIADFIAGMTDRFALTEHARLFETSVSIP
jgi:dGTPase